MDIKHWLSRLMYGTQSRSAPRRGKTMNDDRANAARTERAPANERADAPPAPKPDQIEYADKLIRAQREYDREVFLGGPRRR